MGKAEYISIGPAKGLHFKLLWGAEDTFANDKEDKDFSVGSLQAWLGCELVWGRMVDDEPQGITWHWDELLYSLARSWPFLLFEETYPLGLQPIVPGLLRSEANNIWLSYPRDKFVEEEESIFVFEETHDLSRGVNGITLPKLFLLREGNFMIASTDRISVQRLSRHQTIEALEELGNHIAERIKGVNTESSSQIVKIWDERANISLEQRISITTNLSMLTVRKLAGQKNLAEYWQPPTNSDEPSVLMAAARMVGDSLACRSFRIVCR